MRVACSLFLLLVAFLYPHTVTAEPRPRSVLLLDQSEPNAQFGLQFRAALRATLDQGQADPRNDLFGNSRHRPFQRRAI